MLAFFYIHALHLLVIPKPSVDCPSGWSLCYLCDPICGSYSDERMEVNQSAFYLELFIVIELVFRLSVVNF